MTIEKKKRVIVNSIYFALIAMAMFITLKYLFLWFLPFVIGFFVAMTTQRPANFISRKTHIPKKIVSIFLVVLILFIAGYAIWALSYWLANEISSIATYLATLVKDFPNTLESLKERFGSLFSYLDGTLELPPIVDQLKIFDSISNMLSKLGQTLGNWTLNAAKGIPQFLITSIITIVACCFISMDYDNIVFFIKKQLPVKARKIVVESKRIFFSSIFKMLKAYALIIFITFVELSISLSLIGIEHAVPLSALVAVVDILPVLGIGTILIPWSIITLALGNTKLAFFLIITYAIITVVRNILEPKIVGNQVGIHPVLALMSLYVGAQLFGFKGLIVFPLTLIVIKKLHDSGTIHLWDDVTKEESDSLKTTKK